MPTPNEAKIEAKRIVEEFGKEKALDICETMAQIEQEYIETPYGIDRVRYWQSVRSEIELL